MTKQEFLIKVAGKVNCTKSDVDTIMNAVREVVIEGINEGDEVKPFKGVTIYGAKVEETTKRNPQNGEPIVVPEHVRPKARFAPSFKEEINK